MITPTSRFALLATLTVFALPAALSGCNNVEGMPVIAPLTRTSAPAENSALTTKIKTALAASGDMDNFDIRIQTRKDEVVLNGFADSRAQIDRNLALIRRIDGVGKIINHVSIRRFT
ncbi:BON domain-containing protein [Collimonas sp. OK607]|uniref:BON domain-containing protein n=1 Tax=Collimonas sp. OK607 TaxID=1798194 RepID=UPI0008E9EA86|nr:BON domain-containing protein [Collimonas sp. OK607]SFA75894.1 BON domain-containing protein [Collimonas sp. OK607]